MQKINIDADKFFDLLRSRDVAMWEIFAQMVDGTARLLVFTNADGAEIFSYQLPKDLEQLNSDREIFSAEFQKKLAQISN